MNLNFSNSGNWFRRFGNQAILIIAALGFAGVADFFGKNPDSSITKKDSSKECSFSQADDSADLKPGLFVGCVGFLD